MLDLSQVWLSFGLVLLYHTSAHTVLMYNPGSCVVVQIWSDQYVPHIGSHMVLLSNTGSPCTRARTNYVLTEWARQIAGFNGWVVLGPKSGK